jgi:N-acetylneuraminate lyase
MKFKGIIPAIITPFNEDGTIFNRGLENEINYLYQKGFENIFICGSYGAFPLMTTEERKRVVSIAISLCKLTWIKTIVHIGSTSTKTAVELAKHADACGADAISAVVPFYYSTTIYNEDTFLRYFEEIINSVSIDVHCYNNPNTTGFNVSIPFLKRLMDIGLKGMKDGSSDMGRIISILDIINKDEFSYYPSSTASLITGFLLGVESCISGVALSVPELVLNIYKNVNTNQGYALNLFNKVMKVRSLLGSRSGRAIAAYDVLNAKGVNVGTCREPWLKLKKEDSLWLIDELKKLGGVL